MGLGTTSPLTVLGCALAVHSAAATGSHHFATDSSTFDYVVVGGGTSGLVVANRLTENRHSMSDEKQQICFIINTTVVQTLSS